VITISLIRYIPLTQGQLAIVDGAQYRRVSRFKWCALKRPRNFYAGRTTRLGGKQVTQLMHALLTGYRQTDHIDACGLNNQRWNLRPCTQGQNVANARKRLNCISEYKGVSWFPKTEQWVVHIRSNGKGKNLGYFDDEIEAAKAYDTAATALFGNFARLNFPAPK
jgi:AP2 domain-containing protein